MNTHTTTRRYIVIPVAVALLMASTTMAGERSAAVPDNIDQQIITTIQPSETSVADEQWRAHSKGIGSENVITIPAAAFGYNGNDANGYRFYEFGGYIRGTATGDYCGMAPVYLPHGATITNLWASVLDNDASSNVTITLSRSDTTGFHSASTLASISTSSSSTTIQKPSTSAFSHPVVDMPRYAYYLTTCLPNENTSLYSVRVWFENPELFSDGFELGSTVNWSNTAGGSKVLMLGDTEQGLDEPVPVPLFNTAPPEVQQELRKQAKAYGSPLVIPAADFLCNGQWPGEVTDSTAGYIRAAGYGDVYTQAPVYLPEGAEVASVWAIVYDNDGSCASTDMSVWLDRSDNTTGEMTQMAFMASSGADTDYDWLMDLNPDFPTVSYPDFEYFMVARLCSTNHRLYAIIIFYAD